MLNARQQAFVNFYAKGGFKNASEAAVKAGYSPKTADRIASRLLKNVEVKDAVESLRQPAKEEAIVDAAFVLRQLKDLALTCGQSVPLRDPDTGEELLNLRGEVIYKKVDATGANAALKTLAQCLGVGKEKDKDETIGALAGALLGIINADK